VLRATNPYGTVEEALEVHIADDLPPMQTYTEWAEATIPADGALGIAAREEAADLDRDGLANLLEFLIGGQPLVRDSAPLDIEPVYHGPNSPVPGALQEFLVRFPRHRNPANAGLRLEESIDGVNWKSFAPLPELGDPGSPTIATIDALREIVTYRVLPNPPGVPMLFRLRGENVEP
jgi:hypothetical protein